MSETASQLLQQILTLPPDYRRMIVDRVLDSLGEAPPTAEELFADFWADPDWRAELERRMEQVATHPEELLDGEQVLRELRERYRGESGR